MADYYVTSAEDPHVSAGNAGTLGDPMGLQEAITAMSPGDNVYIMDDGTYVTTSSISVVSSGSGDSLKNVIGVNSSGVEDGSTPIIQPSTSNTICFQGVGTYYHFKNLILRDNNRAGFQGINNSIFENCHSDDSGSRNLLESCDNIVAINCTKTAGTGELCDYLTDGGTLLYCYATNCSGLVGSSNASRRGIIIHGCVAKSTSTDGIRIFSNSDTGVSISNTIVISAGGDGFSLEAEGDCEISLRNCVAYNCTNDGFTTTNGADTGNVRVILDGVVAMDNGGYGYQWNAQAWIHCASAYAYNNTSGSDTGATPKYGSITSLSGDPFADAANDDFKINDTAGAGAVLRAVAETLPGISIETFYPYRSMIDPIGGGGGGQHIYFG